MLSAQSSCGLPLHGPRVGDHLCSIQRAMYCCMQNGCPIRWQETVPMHNQAMSSTVNLDLIIRIHVTAQTTHYRCHCHTLQHGHTQAPSRPPPAVTGSMFFPTTAPGRVPQVVPSEHGQPGSQLQKPPQPHLRPHRLLWLLNTVGRNRAQARETAR